MNKRRGFTLIELLVVISIIAILATVVIINVTGAKAKAQNAKIMSDLNTVGKAASIHGVYHDFRSFKDYDYGGQGRAGDETGADQRMNDYDVSQFKDGSGNSIITKAPIPPVSDEYNVYEIDYGYSYSWYAPALDTNDDALSFLYPLSTGKVFECRFGQLWLQYGGTGCRTN